LSPSKRHQLALPQTGHRGREIHRTVDLAVRPIDSGVGQRSHLKRLNEPDLGALGLAGQLDMPGYVHGQPSLALGETEQRREVADVVADRLCADRTPIATVPLRLRSGPLALLHHHHQILNVLGRDPAQIALREEGLKPNAQDRLHSRRRRLLAALTLQVREVAASQLGHRQHFARGHPGGLRLRDQPAQLCLGLAACQAVPGALDAHRADTTLDLPSTVRTPMRIPDTSTRVERASSVWTSDGLPRCGHHSSSP
jgi:hypothetical protein